MKRKQYIIIGIIVLGLGILAGFKNYIGPKVTLMKVEKSIEDIPIEIVRKNLILMGIQENRYPTQNQMLKKAKIVMRPFAHNLECKGSCKAYHEDNYKLETDFNRLDKIIKISGQTYGFPFRVELHNDKRDEYNLYYRMAISLLSENQQIESVQKAIDQIEKVWGEEVKQEVQILGTIQGELEDKIKKEYAKQIFDSLGVYTQQTYVETIDDKTVAYYGYLTYFKGYEKNAKGNKYNVVVRFTLDKTNNQTKMSLEFPSKI